jgi:UDP-2,3-diacylglucosamine pyrophosphatase LpxH
MHDQLLAALLAVANIRLVASYTDDQLGFPGDDSIQVFIPDLHLLSAARRALYDYGTNNEPTLIKAMAALRQLKNDAIAAGKSVVVFHIGDYLDLWRESLLPDLDPAVPERIKDDHQDLVNLLEDPTVNTHFLLGNHDFDLYKFTGYNTWERRFFIPGDAPTAVVMHGDYFDWVERNAPETLRDIAVYLFSESHPAGDALIGQMRNLALSCKLPDYSNLIQSPQPAVIGALQPGGGDVPANYNLQTAANATPDGTKFLESACKECVNANAASGTKLRMVIIGHTHHARIATMTMPDGTPFALVDTGAWIEDCSDGNDGAPIPNSQITALSANQVRIYQLDPRG